MHSGIPNCDHQDAVEDQTIGVPRRVSHTSWLAPLARASGQFLWPVVGAPGTHLGSEAESVRAAFDRVFPGLRASTTAQCPGSPGRVACCLSPAHWYRVALAMKT